MSDAVDNPIQATDLVKATEQEALGETPPASGKPSQTSIEHLLDIPLRLSIELGRTRMAIGELLMLNPGSVIELDKAAGEPLDIMVNGRPVARGEAVVVNDKFGIRVTDVLSPTDRLQRLTVTE